MRAFWLPVLAACTGVAGLAGLAPHRALAAEPDARALPPVAIELVEKGACFDARTLAVEIERQVPAAEVSVGPSAVDGVAVTVRARRATLDVEVTRRFLFEPDRRERRTIAAVASCPALTETAPVRFNTATGTRLFANRVQRVSDHAHRSLLLRRSPRVG